MCRPRVRRSRRAAADYAPRRPEGTALYGVLQQHLATFLARGFCPSCGGRRMADTAAHLVDRVLPRAPVRQWVLTLPWRLRYRLGYDSQLAAQVLQVFVRAVFAALRRRARERYGIRDARCGAVTLVQRFGGALNLNVHFHSLVLDGVYDARSGRFRALPPPEDAEIVRVARRIARRLARQLDQGDADREDPLSVEQPLLATLYGASVRGRIATGRRAGQAVERRRDGPGLGVKGEGSLCATVGGLGLHAAVQVRARDRRKLERLCRYVARPPLASERLSALPDGRLAYRLRHRWSDGTSAVVFEPLELIEKLAALVPPPRFHLVRYHGVFAPAARLRAQIVPEGPVAETVVERSPRPSASGPERERRARTPPRARNYGWAELMRRVFEIDVLICPRCTGALRILAHIHPPEATRAILDHLRLPGRPPPLAPVRQEASEDWAS